MIAHSTESSLSAKSARKFLRSKTPIYDMISVIMVTT